MVRRVIFLTILMVLVTLGKTESGWDRSVEEWTKWSHAARLYYLMGVLDGWVNISAGMNKTEDMKERGQIATMFTDLVDCQKNKLLTYQKVYSLVEAEIVVYPGREKYALASLIWTAVARACGYKFPE